MVDTYILATDPRGYVVEFSKDRWDWITKKHPELIKNNVTPENLKSAIENPSDGCIYNSATFYKRDLYYTQYNKILQIRVVVKYEKTVGQILTAHFIKERPSGETIKWMKGRK